MGQNIIIDGVTYSGDMNTLLEFPDTRTGSFCVPDGVKIIGGNAFFRCIGLEEVIFPDSLERIEHAAFCRCTGLKRVCFGSGLKQIGESAFSGCTSLSDMTLPQGLEEILTCAFETCKSLKEVTLPSSVKKVGQLSFARYTVVRCSPELFRSLSRDARKRTVRALLGELDSLSEEYRKEVAKCVRNYGGELLNDIILGDDIAALAGYFQFRKKLSLAELSHLVDQAADAKAHGVLATLLDRKNRDFPPEAVTEYENDRIEKAMGLQERSVAEWRRIFKYHIKDGSVILTEYKGKDENLIIPGKIGNTPVRKVNLLWLYSRKFQDVYVSEGVEELYYQLSFAGRPMPQRLHLPASLTTISFLPVENGKPLILAPEGSFAQQYALEKGLPFQPE